MKTNKRSRFSNNRRNFLEKSVKAGSVALVSMASVPSNVNSASISLTQGTKPFELDEVTIQALQEGLSSGKWTSRKLVEKYLGRIDEIDRNGPKVNSVIEANPDALAIAESFDRERKAGRVRGPLHGIPILIKDNIDTADRMKTS